MMCNKNNNERPHASLVILNDDLKYSDHQLTMAPGLFRQGHLVAKLRNRGKLNGEFVSAFLNQCLGLG